MALVPVLLAILLLMVFPRYNSVSTLPSPDGRFICYVKGGGSGATVDFTSVTVRPAWRLVAQEAYFTFGGFDPEVRWTDPKTIEIRYPEHDDPEFCQSQVADVHVVCKPAPRNEKGLFPLMPGK
jgi:hypothetical protein